MAAEGSRAPAQVDFWDDVGRELRKKGPGAEAVIPRGKIAHPKTAGASLSMGISTRRGHRADWRFPPAADGSGLHVQEFAGEWRAHVDKVHPMVSAAKHFAADVGPLMRHPVVKQAVAGAIVGMVTGYAARKLLQLVLR